MSKELWIEVFEELEEELGREPTDDEVQVGMEDKMALAYDRAKDLRKYGH